MDEALVELVFMMVILKLPVVYLCLVVWWAVRSGPPPQEVRSPPGFGAGGGPGGRRSPRGPRHGPHGGPVRRYARRPARRTVTVGR